MNTMIPGPVAPPLPELSEHIPYRMPDVLGLKEASKPRVWVVNEAELEAICEWIIPKLRKKWPNLNEDGVRYWFRSAIADRTTHFIRTENVVGMIYSSVDVLEPQPIVRERFVRSKKGASSEEKLLIYKTFREWARSINAREFIFGVDTDIGMDINTGGVARHLQNDREASNVSEKTYYICTLKEK